MNINKSEITQGVYGHYCSMCIELGIEPRPYRVFKDTGSEEYNNVRETYLTFKR
jgi:hypothetical protein